MMKKSFCRMTALLLLLCFALSFLSACANSSAEKRLDETQESFFQLIEAKKFSEAYDLLSSESQRTLTRESFVAHYNNLLEKLGRETSIKIERQPFEATSSLYQSVEFKMSYNSPVFGELSNDYVLQLVREGEIWRVYWMPSLIFPSMDWSDTLNVVTKNPTRGEIFASGKLVATNQPGQTIYAVPSKIKNMSQFASALSPYIGMDTEKILKALDRSKLMGHTSVASLNIRSSPSLESDVLLTVNQGESFEVLNQGVVSVSTALPNASSSDDKDFLESLLDDDKASPENTATASDEGETNPQQQKLPEFYRVKYNDGGKDLYGYAYAPYVTLYYSQDIVILKSFPPDTLPLSTQQKITSIEGASIDTNGMTNYRIYPYGESFFHTVGYVSEITESQLESYESQGLKELFPVGSIIGQTGLERQYELELRGKQGIELYISSFDGSKRRSLYKQAAEDGKDIHLSIDADLQQYAYDLLRLYLGPVNQTGAVVVNNPQTGAVLTVASYPSVDPNSFYTMSNKEWSQLNTATDSGYPMINRTINSAYVPGSVFKPFTAAVAMNEQKIDSQTLFPYASQIEEDRWIPNADNWVGQPIKRIENKGWTDEVNFWNSMAHSDNIFFAWTSLQVGKSSFLDYCVNRLGFTEDIPFDLPVSKSRIVNAQIQKATKDDPQAILDAFTYELLADSGFGQGQMIMTPLHVASLFGAFSKEGDVMRPYIVDSIRHSEGVQYFIDTQTEPQLWKSKIVDDSQDFKDIQKSLIDVFKYGTAANRVPFSEYSLAGKTGTAEKSKTEDISWLAAYKADDPQDYTVVVAIECPTKLGAGRYEIVSNLFRYEYTHEIGKQFDNVDNGSVSNVYESGPHNGTDNGLSLEDESSEDLINEDPSPSEADILASEIKEEE